MITFQNFYANYSQYVDELKQEPETTKDVKKRMTKSLGYTMERSQKGLGLSDQSDQDNQGRFKNVIQGMTWLEEKD
jgi:hypothetical protein